jgi:hypothetical protein
MSHFAKLNADNIVIFVTAGRQEDDGKELELSERTGEVYKQTSYNTRGGVHYNAETGEPSADQSKALRKNYAGLGYSYDSERDAFVSPKPYDSWVLDEETCLWIPPVSRPQDEALYIWDEATLSWIRSDDGVHD